MADTIIPPRRKAEFFDESGNPTFRFIKWVEFVTGQTNTTTATVESEANVSGFSAQVQQLRLELNGLPQFTIDTTGFTTDLTFITTDKVIA